MNKTNRNDPCPCGSGKKYKKCCLPREEAAQTEGWDSEKPFITELLPDVDDAVDRALEGLEQGDTRGAEQEIARLLECHPNYHMTNYAMGVYLGMVAKNTLAAIPFFERAVALFPQFAEAHCNLGMCARKNADFPQAVEAFRAAERCTDDEGIAKRARKEIEWMENVVLKGTEFSSLDDYIANARLFSRALEFMSCGRFSEAVEIFQHVLSKDSHHVQSYGNLALAFAGLGRRSEALAALARALELDPDYDPAKMNRRGIEQMREGEPLIMDNLKIIEFYTDRHRAQQSSGDSST